MKLTNLYNKYVLIILKIIKYCASLKSHFEQRTKTWTLTLNILLINYFTIISKGHFKDSQRTAEKKY